MKPLVPQKKTLAQQQQQPKPLVVLKGELVLKGGVYASEHINSSCNGLGLDKQEIKNSSSQKLHGSGGVRVTRPDPRASKTDPTRPVP